MAQATEAQMERARKLAETAASWPRGTARKGGYPVWLVPSQSRQGLFHRTTRCQCDCPAWVNGRMCVHVLSVRILAAKECPNYATATRTFTAPFDASRSVAALSARYAQIWGEGEAA